MRIAQTIASALLFSLAEAATTSATIIESLPTSTRTDAPVIALTFDDGPDPIYTAQKLNILNEYQVPATFFVIGENVQQYPDLVKQVSLAGNVVGNHSWSHPDLTQLSADAITAELARTNTVIQLNTCELMCEPVSYFRPPYGNTNQMVEVQAEELNLQTVLWTIDTLDWQGISSQQIVETVLSDPQNGDIVLMHDWTSETVAALPEIITGLEEKGFEFVTLDTGVPVAEPASLALFAAGLTGLGLVCRQSRTKWCIR